MTEDEKTAEAWATALREISAEIASGKLLSVAWVADRGYPKHHFGHIGFKPGRETLTSTLITLRDGTAAAPTEIN